MKIADNTGILDADEREPLEVEVSAAKDQENVMARLFDRFGVGHY
jgi:hypothetical protein